MGAEQVTAGAFTPEAAGERDGGYAWHTSVVAIVLVLGFLGIFQILFVHSRRVQDLYYLAYFIPIGIAAMHLSWRSAVEASLLSTVVYLLASSPELVVVSWARPALALEVAGHAALFIAAGVGLSTYRLRIGREKERALNAERERARKLELMLDVSSTVSSSLKLEQVLQVLAVRIAEAVDATFCRVSLLDDEKESLSIVAAYPVRDMDWEPAIGRALPLSELPDHRQAVETGKAVIVTREEGAREGELSGAQRHMMQRAATLLLYPLVVEGEALGVVCIGEQRRRDRAPLDFEKAATCQTIVNQGAKTVAHALTHRDLEEAFLGTIRSLAAAIDAKDPSTHGHSEWVSRYAVMIGRQLGLGEEEVEELRFAGYLHDVGKIGISDRILGKPSQLSPEQWRLMRKHPVVGARILEPVNMPAAVKGAVRHHHERFDGRGYPDGLAGEEIPLGARVLAVADSFEAMTANRPYRKALSEERAVAELRRCAGTQFDPAVVDAFLVTLGRVPSRQGEAVVG